MKVCNSCGAQNEDSTRFCTTCGTAFNGPAPVPAPEPAPAPDPYQPTYQPTYQPDYGSSYQQNVYQPVMMNSNPATFSALAVTGFVISIVSIFCCGITAPLGLIFSIAGLFAAARKDKKGMGLAIAGTIINGIATLFIVFVLILCGSAIKTAYEEAENGDFDEFMEILQEELEEMDEHGSYGYSTRRSGNSDAVLEAGEEIRGEWNDYEVSDDLDSVTITYTDGIDDDFEFYGADFDEICDALEDEMVVTNSFGQSARFDRETFRRLVSMQFISPEEYERMGLTRDQAASTLAYLATLSFEMSSDNFCPDWAIYYSDSNSYEYYGILDPHGLGHSVIVFTDGTNQVNFDDAMAGDEICWAYDFGDPEVYRLGMSSDTLNEYPANGFLDVANWAYSIIDPLM